MMKKLRGIILDLDGVVVKSNLNFQEISKKIFGKRRFPLLENILQIEDSFRREHALKILKKYENKAASTCSLNDGMYFLFSLLNKYGIKKGLVTRNNRESVCIILEKFKLDFDAIVTREDTLPKPAKEPIIVACNKMGLVPPEVVVLGDYEFDMVAGKSAGAFTVLLKNPLQPYSQYADRVVTSIQEFIDFLKPLLDIRSPTLETT